MGAQSKIEWTNASWNPIRARNLQTSAVGWFCIHKSSGCINCYAETLNHRLGTGIDFKAQNASLVELFLDERTLLAPLRWKKPRKIFVGSMTDLFADFVPDDFIDRMFAVMALCPQHTFQVLTKRPERMREYLTATNRTLHIAQAGAGLGDLWWGNWLKPWPLPNVWLGTSCEDQPTADERIPHLLVTPAAVRFLSCEPLLGPVDLKNVRWTDEDAEIRYDATSAEAWVENTMSAAAYTNECDGNTKIDWAIAGGESGPNARPMHPDWPRSLRDQCATAGIPYFFKQWGEWEPREQWSGHLGGGHFERMIAIMPAGGECPNDVAPQDVGAHRMARVGKGVAGRKLDCREWNEFPGLA